MRVTRAHCERQYREGISFHEELTKDVLGLHFQIDDTVGKILSVHTA